MSYSVLSVEERATIQICHAQGLSLRKIACFINRPPRPSAERCAQWRVLRSLLGSCGSAADESPPSSPRLQASCRFSWFIKTIDWGRQSLYLRNVKGYRWNHKRVYRIYRELELNLRIKPRERIVREKPLPLAVPNSINQCWSMDFMHDQLSDGRSFRIFNLIDDFNRE
jgi:hypothetical protein